MRSNDLEVGEDYAYAFFTRQLPHVDRVRVLRIGVKIALEGSGFAHNGVVVVHVNDAGQLRGGHAQETVRPGTLRWTWDEEEENRVDRDIEAVLVAKEQELENERLVELAMRANSYLESDVFSVHRRWGNDAQLIFIDYSVESLVKLIVEKFGEV